MKRENRWNYLCILFFLSLYDVGHTHLHTGSTLNTSAAVPKTREGREEEYL